MGTLIDILSGVTVYNAIDRLFGRRLEPYYRRKALKMGFGVEFEQELVVLKDRGADHASVRAFNIARRRFRATNIGA